MLKSRTITLSGRDEGRQIILTELAALTADRHARTALRRIDADLNGGIVAVAMRDQKKIAALGDEGSDLLLPFVSARDAVTFQPLDWRTLRDWRNVSRLQQTALLLHVDFLIGREVIEAPVTMRAEQIMSGSDDVAVSFCSPSIAAVLQSGKATYAELESIISTEDAFNIVELLNVEAIREWQNMQTIKKAKHG
jgi:hypothetical protein